MQEYNNIKVSVIMAVYNTKEEYLIDAVKSILKQTHQNFELIIVDDASTECSFDNEIFKDKHIVILHNDTCRGPSYSRNRALKISTGEYIAIMDSDDISYSNRVQEQVRFLEENKKVVACGTWFKFFGMKNHEVKRIIDDHDYYRCCLLFNNAPTILNPSVMIRRKVLIENNIFWNEELRLGEDYLMWVQLSEIGIITNLNEILINYRIHKSQATSSNNRKKIDNNTWIIQKYQLDKVGITLNEEDYKLLTITRIDDIRKLIRINNIISSIIKANYKTNYYNNASLEKRCKEQIKTLVFSTNNPFRLLYLLFNKNFSEYAKEAICYKTKRFLKIEKLSLK